LHQVTGTAAVAGSEPAAVAGSKERETGIRQFAPVLRAQGWAAIAVLRFISAHRE